MPRLMNKKQSISYPRGVCPVARRFAMSMQLAMLQRALAPWPRRQAPLLEVNCGNGAFLQFLWQSGFDVQGVEADPGLRLAAQKRPVPGLEIYAAHDENLPFANDSFDWVIIHLKTNEEDGIEKCANEGARLARRGIMLTFWNSSSLPALCWAVTHKKPWSANSVSWWSVWRELQSLGLGRIAILSTLLTPVWTWRRQWRFGGTMRGLPLGAWCAIRVDIGPLSTGTPLPLRLGIKLPENEPAMEFAPKRNQLQPQKRTNHETSESRRKNTDS